MATIDPAAVLVNPKEDPVPRRQKTLGRTGRPGRPVIPPPRRAGPPAPAYGAKGKRSCFTNGCFDIQHAGHAQYLRRAASLGDLLFVGLNGDASVRS